MQSIIEVTKGLIDRFSSSKVEMEGCQYSFDFGDFIAENTLG